MEWPLGSNSRAKSSGLRPARTRSTICWRNSGECGGCVLGIDSTSGKSFRVSTKPGQSQSAPGATSRSRWPRSRCRGKCSRKSSRSLPGCGRHQHQHEWEIGSDATDHDGRGAPDEGKAPSPAAARPSCSPFWLPKGRLRSNFVPRRLGERGNYARRVGHSGNIGLDG